MATLELTANRDIFEDHPPLENSFAQRVRRGRDSSPTRRPASCGV